jgi:hypothetical protein
MSGRAADGNGGIAAEWGHHPPGGEMTGYKTKLSCWQGFPPPQYLYSNLEFRDVALEPPNFEPGSWTGGGKALLDYEERVFYLTARPRKMEDDVRGFAIEIHRSTDGVAFDLLTRLSIGEVTELSGVRTDSLEGSQLLRDPSTGKWHLYISIDVGAEFIWGGVFWETLLLVADDLEGPWESRGLVLRRDREYDACQARDASIDIVDGEWIGFAKAYDYDGNQRTQMITSADGIRWDKHGPMRVDGEEQYMFYASGTTFAGASGPIFLGVARSAPRLPEPVPDILDDPWKRDNDLWHYDFVAFRIDRRHVNFETIFRAPWVGRSKYELEGHPLHNYCSVVHDPYEDRLLFYLEAIGPDSKAPSLNESVERVLVYECRL